MRVRPLACLAILILAGCGENDPGAKETDSRQDARDVGWPLDGFLHYLPEEASITLRLPTAADVDRRPGIHRALLEQLGRGDSDPHALYHGVAQPEGIDPERAPGFARTTGGGWTLYLPALDKGVLNQSLRERAEEFDFREAQQWILMSKGSAGGGNVNGDPLPPGEFALRLQYHPLVSLLLPPGDCLEAGVDLGGGGIALRGRVAAGEMSATRRLVADAKTIGSPGLLDYIPSKLALRVEFSLPPTILAGLLTRRIGAHCGIAEESDRVILERLLREALTGADPAAGFAFGVEFRQRETSIVALGRLAEGAPSPIIEGLLRRDRSEFGAVVVDPRETERKGITGLGVWVIDAQPKADGLPTSLLNLLVGLAGSEDEPLQVCYAEAEGWFFVGIGPRGDLLVSTTRRRATAQGARRSLGSRALFSLRTSADWENAPYLLGVVFQGSGLEGLDASDRADLARLFGGNDGASSLRAFALAGFRRDGELVFEGRGFY